MGKSNGRLEKEEFWRLVLEEQRESGLSIRAFCQREKLSEPSYFVWRKKLEKRDRIDDRRGRQPGNGNTAAAKLVPVELISDDDETSEAIGSNLLEIVTPGGLTLRFGDSFRSDRLKDLLTSVMQVETEEPRC